MSDLVNYIKFGTVRTVQVPLLGGHTYSDSDGVYEIQKSCTVDAVQVFRSNGRGGGEWKFLHYDWSSVRES